MDESSGGERERYIACCGYLARTKKVEEYGRRRYPDQECGMRLSI